MALLRGRRLSRWLAFLGLIAFVTLTAWVAWETWWWPDVQSLAQHNPPSTAFIDAYRVQERAQGREGRVAWTWAPYAAIAPNLKRAVLVAEDIGFFRHRGFEPAELRDAVERALETHEMPRGASTITQQLAKNLWLSPSRSPVRKLKEAMLTWQIERHISAYLGYAHFFAGDFIAETGPSKDVDFLYASVTYTF